METWDDLRIAAVAFLSTAGTGSVRWDLDVLQGRVSGTRRSRGKQSGKVSNVRETF